MARNIKVSIRRKNRGLETISRIVKEIESILDQYGDWEKAIIPLREAIDRNLGNNEFMSL